MGTSALRKEQPDYNKKEKMTTLILARHGESFGNKMGYEWVDFDHLNFLTSIGCHQAHELCKKLSSHRDVIGPNVKPLKVFSSALTRARQTAVMATVNIETTCIEEFNERDPAEWPDEDHNHAVVKEGLQKMKIEDGYNYLLVSHGYTMERIHRLLYLPRPANLFEHAFPHVYQIPAADISVRIGQS